MGEIVLDAGAEVLENAKAMDCVVEALEDVRACVRVSDEERREQEGL